MPVPPSQPQTSRLRVPLARLPQSDVSRHAALRDYFCDKDATASLAGDEWQLSLHWPDATERHIDPRLTEGLAWWDPTITPAGMALSWRRDRHILTSLYDSWTLYSWADWLSRNKANGLVVLHFDDHRDFGSPRLFATSHGFVDAITGQPVAIGDPVSVQRAIESGAIGMGSFFTLLFHSLEGIQVRHLCQPPKVNSSLRYAIECYLQQDTLLDVNAARPTVRLVPEEKGGDGNAYLVTDDPNWLVQDLPTGTPILVHIDMDFFNNRYDGDSEWIDRLEVLNPPFDDILAKIDQVGRTLQDPRVANKIVDVVISYSPGFFPAEFWSAADARLRPLLEALR